MFQMDDALEEGRAALLLLEKQLKDRNFNSDASVGSRSQQNSLHQERKILDKIPRDARLHHRQESLGLTVEELDDRGLLDGGGSLPSYYSSKQKNRRPLEMRKRSLRLQERGHEATKLQNSLFHMIRALTKRGLNIEEYCREMDPENRGVINRKQFISVLRHLGLPFSKRDLAEISQRYTLAGTEEADYEALLRDAGILNEGEGEMTVGGVDIGMYAGVLMDVKRMLLESIRSLSKTPEDVFRMFAQWDHEGIGTVTATQFLRVLARLHIELSDNDQDFLIELLDTNDMGRIDFESLLSFCFGDLPSLAAMTSPSATISTHADDRSAGNVNMEFPTPTEADGSSLGSHSARGAGRRPHTASAHRPVHGYFGETIGPIYSPNLGASHVASGNIHNSFPFATPQVSSSALPPLLVPGRPAPVLDQPYGRQDRLSSSHGQRPTTAAARVATGNYNDANNRNNNSSRYYDSDGRQHIISEFPDDIINDNDNDDEGEYYLQYSSNGNISRPAEEANRTMNDTGNNQYYSMNFANYSGNSPEFNLDGVDLQDMGSLNDTTLITEQGEYLASPTGMLPIGASFLGQGNISNIDNYASSGDIVLDLAPPQLNSAPFRSDWPGRPHGSAVLSNNNQYSGNDGGIRAMDESGGRNSGGGGGVMVPPPLERLASKDGLLGERSKAAPDPSGANVTATPPHNIHPVPPQHLNDLAMQTLTAVRDMLLNRMKYGTKLRALYQHFDRQGKMYIDANDFVVVTAEMRMETSERVAEIAINQLAVDGIDQVSFGEFKIFVKDSDHEALERMFLAQVAQQLERQGRNYQTWLLSAFWEQEIASRNASNSHGGGNSSLRDVRYAQNQLAQSGMVRSQTFRETLAAMGTKLSPADTERFVDRFDVHGQGQCSVSRFLRFVQESSQWREAEKVLSFQEEAIEEAAMLREQLRREGKTSIPGLTEELLSMAEYLGIRSISEQHLLWIAADALRAPLPVSWSVQKDNQGRTFFYNHISNQSRWDHPLDPHFRKLRDDYRQSNEMEDSANQIPAVKLPPGLYKATSMGSLPSSNLPSMTQNAVNAKNSTQTHQLFHNSSSSGRSSADERLEGDDTFRFHDAGTGQHANVPVGRLRPQSAVSILANQSGSSGDKQKFQVRTPGDSDLRNIYAAQYAEHVQNGGKMSSLHRPTSAPNFISELMAQKGMGDNALYEAYKPIQANTATHGAFSTEMKKKTLEDIYKSNLTSKKIAKGSMTGSTQLSSVGGNVGNSNGGAGGHQRLSSAGRTRPANNNANANHIVDKALNVGKEPTYLMQVASKSGKEKEKARNDYSSIPPTREELNRSAQLADMFDDGIISKLDCIILPRTNSKTELLKNQKPTVSYSSQQQQQQQQQQQPIPHKKNKGGIVLM